MVNIISPNANNITSFKVYFNPKQEGTGDPSPENVREIVGWNGVEVYTRGKNLLKYWKNGYYNRYGGYFYPGDNNAGFYPIRVKKTDSIYFSAIAPIASGSIAFFTDEYNFTPDTFISQISIASSETGRITRKIESPQDCWMYLQIDYQSKRTAENAFEKEPQIEIGSSSTNYKPFQGTTTSIDWTNNIGNIYGGYVDLVTGELVATQKLLTITGNEDVTYRVFQDSIYTGSTLFLSDSEEITSPSMSIKGVCSFASTNDGIVNRDYLRKAYSDRGLQFYKVSEYWGLSEVTSEALVNKLQTWNSLGTPLQICYSLANPITVATLSPIQLSTLKGQNNFWSNADYVEIEYELTETFDIQKAKRKIILNQPHVESTSGTIAKPETDMIGKIKECKIHFMPVQQGDSDPTPDNIVPVTGWTGIDVYQAFIEYPITPIIKTIEENGVKWVVDKDGLMTAYGTPTAFTGANLGMIDVNGDETLYGVVTGSLNNVTFNKPTLLDSNSHSINYSAGDGILITGLDLSLYNDVKRIRVSLKRGSNVFMSGSCNAIIWKDKIPTISTTSIDWTDIAGTMYGGYVDLISGELVQEFKQCKINELSWIYESNGKCFMSGKNTPNDILKDKSLLGSYIRSNYYTPIDGYGSAATYANKQDYSISLYAPSDQYRAVIKDSRFTDVSSFLSAMGDTYVWYRLAEPTVTYQLTPQQLTTLRGINNIWSSANGEVEIKYWKH